VSDPDYLDRLVDDDALGAYLTAEFGSADTFAVERHAEGHSNETLFVTWGDRELVVRRPPPARRPTRPTTCSGSTAWSTRSVTPTFPSRGRFARL